MATYRVRVQGPNGAEVRELDAIDLQDAERRGSKFGQVLQVKKSRSFDFGGLSFTDRQIFLTRLSQMLASKLGEGESLKLMHTTFGGQIKKTSKKLIVLVESGADMPSAIEQLGSPNFPPQVAAMIAAGAKSGETHRALRDAAKFEQEMAQIKKGSNAALFKSVGTMLLAMGAVLATVFYGYPRIKSNPMLKGAGDAINVGWAETLAYGVAYAIMAVFVLMIIFGLISTVGRLVAPRFADAIILRIPYFRDLVLAKYNYIAFYGLSLMVHTGVRIRDAIVLTAGSMRPGALKSDMERAAEAISEGKSWSHSLRSLHPTDRAALASSMDSSQIAKTLENIGQQYKEIYRIRVDAMGPALQSLAMLAMVIAGVVIFGLIILPMMQAMQAIM